MYLDTTIVKHKHNTVRVNNIHRNYNGGIVDYMNVSSQIIHMLTNPNVLVKIWIYLKCFFKSFLWVFHKKTVIKGELLEKVQIYTWKDNGEEYKRFVDRENSKDIKRITYYFLRIIPIWHWRYDTLTEEEFNEIIN